MERFSLEKKIPSCLVNKNLLGELERYLVNRIPKKISGLIEKDKQIKPTYNLKIEDGFGEEYIDSIEEYHRDKFANDTKEITLNFWEQ